jgi:hypothetical protein
MYNRDLNYKPKDLKAVLMKLPQSQVFEMYANILELQNSCLVLMPSDGQDVYNKYLEHLLSEIMRTAPGKSDRKPPESRKNISSKNRITSQNFQMNDPFHEKYITEVSGEPLFDAIQLQVYAGYSLVPILPLVPEPTMNYEEDSDSVRSSDPKDNKTIFCNNYDEVCQIDGTPASVFREALEPLFSNSFQVKDADTNNIISAPLRIFVLGGREELQFLVQNLGWFWEEHHEIFLDIDFRVYLFPITGSDLAAYIAANDIWYHTYVYYQASKNDPWVPFVGETKGSKDDQKINAKKFQGKAGNALAQKKKAEEEGEDP